MAESSGKDVTVVIQVHKKLQSSIIGKGGQTVRKLQNDNKVRVIIPRKEEGDDTHQVTIIGAAERVAKCKNEIDAILGFETSTAALERFLLTGLPKARHGVVIGKSGTTLRSLEASGKCIITVPDRLDNSETIMIDGHLDAALLTKSRIEELVKQDVILSRPSGEILGSKAPPMARAVSADSKSNISVLEPPKATSSAESAAALAVSAALSTLVNPAPLATSVKTVEVFKSDAFPHLHRKQPSVSSSASTWGPQKKVASSEKSPVSPVQAGANPTLRASPSSVVSTLLSPTEPRNCGDPSAIGKDLKDTKRPPQKLYIPKRAQFEIVGKARLIEQRLGSAGPGGRVIKRLQEEYVQDSRA